MMRKMFFALMIAVGLISCSSVLITQAAETNKFGIKIDGNFDDWKDKPMTDIKNPWNGDPVKQASLLTDGKYIYYYITMSKTGRDNYPFQVNDHQLTVGNKMHSIYIKRAYDIPANKTKKSYASGYFWWGCSNGTFTSCDSSLREKWQGIWHYGSQNFFFRFKSCSY